MYAIRHEESGKELLIGHEGIERIDEFKNAARPLMKYLAENCHPHMSVIVWADRAELVEGRQCFSTEEYIQD